jgi:DNA polymerase III alpha subunit (gram-positive type)
MKKISGMVVIGLLALFIGLVISIQITTTQGSDHGGLIPYAKAQGYLEELKQVRTEKDAALQELNELEKRLEKIEAEKAAKLAALNENGSNSRGNGNGMSKWNGKDRQETPVVGNRIMGKRIREESVPISSLTVDIGTAVINGTLFHKEARTIKNNKKLVTLLITDKTTSVCVKVFASENKWNDIDHNLKPGDYVKIRGNTEFDTFENALVLIGKDIEKIEKEGRQDHSEKKRVELHAHTKMSAMDGLNDVSEMIRTAAIAEIIIFIILLFDSIIRTCLYCLRIPVHKRNRLIKAAILVANAKPLCAIY